jgi:hypothetical protein
MTWKDKYRESIRKQARKARTHRAILIASVVLFIASGIVFIAIGKPVLILASIAPVALVMVMKGGLSLKDLAFLIWIDGSKDKE